MTGTQVMETLPAIPLSAAKRAAKFKNFDFLPIYRFRNVFGRHDCMQGALKQQEKK